MPSENNVVSELAANISSSKLPSEVNESWLEAISPEKRDSVRLLSLKIESAKTADEAKEQYLRLSKIYMLEGNRIASVYWGSVLAEKMDASHPDFQKLVEDVYSASLFTRQDTSLFPLFTGRGISLLEDNGRYKTSDQLQVLLARFYVDGAGAVMKGVGLLHEIVAEDSLQVEANILLGKLGIQSGQFAKSKMRLQRALQREPSNGEALYYLGEVYLSLDEKAAAIETFEKCIALSEDPGFKQELNTYIERIKSSL